MIFSEGLPKQYSLLRNKNPAIFYLEDFHFKILQLNVDKEYSVFLNNSELEEDEDIITLNFPEFLDVSSNLELIKKIFFEVDLAFTKPGDITLNDTKVPLNLVGLDKELNSLLETPKSLFSGRRFKPFPEGMITLFFGYRYTAVKDVRTKLENTESLCCEQLVKMEDTCFNWIPVPKNSLGLKEKTLKPTVCKFKVEVSIPLLKEWLNTVFTPGKFNYFIEGMNASSLDLNFIMHPPYIDRMSFKDNIKIVYPLKTTKLKVIDKVTFRANRSYTTNNKIYQVFFIDKDTNQKLFSFNSVDHNGQFTNLKNNINTKAVNSYFDEEVVSFEDGVLINFNVPNPVQLALSKHNNYKIRIVAKDLTTQNRGNNVSTSL